MSFQSSYTTIVHTHTTPTVDHETPGALWDTLRQSGERDAVDEELGRILSPFDAVIVEVRRWIEGVVDYLTLVRLTVIGEPETCLDSVLESLGDVGSEDLDVDFGLVVEIIEEPSYARPGRREKKGEEWRRKRSANSGDPFGAPTHP